MPKQLDLNLLRYLCEVIEIKSAFAAAKNLQTSSSAVSTALSKLRKYDGELLFFRQGSGMSPTALALELYKNFQPALNALQLADKYKKSAEMQVRQPRIRIACGSMIALLLMQYMLDEAQVNSDFNWDVSSHHTIDAVRLERLRRMQVDIDIGTELQSYRAILGFPLFSCGLSLVCRQDHPRIKIAVSAEEFKKETLIGYISPKESFGNEVLFAQFDDEFLQYKNCRCCSAISILLLAEKGDNVTFIPSALATWACRMFNLKVVSHSFKVNAFFHIFAYISRLRGNYPILTKLVHLFDNLN